MGSCSLYVPQLEHDSCGIGFVADLKKRKSFELVQDAIKMLENMEHRGGCGSEPETGDGAGIMLEIPHWYFSEEMEKEGVELPGAGQYGVGMLFLPPKEELRQKCEDKVVELSKLLNFEVLGFRTVGVDNSHIGKTAQTTEPIVKQVFVKLLEEDYDGQYLERKLFVLRNFITHSLENEIEEESNSFYIASFSQNTIVYKGQLRTNQLRLYYTDLQDHRVISRFAIVHSRFSTNTFPNWKLAQPFRYLAHNGEINTIRGNVNNMKSREAVMESSLFSKEDIERLLPICNSKNSDSANLDNLVELLVLGGRSLPHVLMMLIPEAWEDNKVMDMRRKAFYKYHASIMEPWDGPASICFTDGKMIGATLDRNGLRPSRYCVTSDGRVVMSSEAGALPVDQSKVISKGRLQPGKMFVVDLDNGLIRKDNEIKEEVCSQQHYGLWVNANRLKLRHLSKPNISLVLNEETLIQRQQLFGYSTEDQKLILAAMAEMSKEPLGSMGADIPLAVLSHQSQHISNYFKQLFAQVSNPPIDPIRERTVMSLFTRVGKSLNILEETPDHCKQIHISRPVLTIQGFEKLKTIDHPDFKTNVINAVFRNTGKEGALEKAIIKLCLSAEKAVQEGSNIIVISDKKFDRDYLPIPSLLATGAVHHHLIEKKLRNQVGIVVEAGDVWETHHYATLIGYGASAVYPYMAFETILYLLKSNQLEDISEEQAISNYISAVGGGLLKIMSKMGISTLHSYQSAQIFEALGLSDEVIEKCFTGTVSRIGGLTFDDITKEMIARHHLAYSHNRPETKSLETGGVFQWKRRGEFHLFNPDTIHLLQHSSRTNNFELYKQYAKKINDQSEKACTLRSLFEFKKSAPISLDEVESKESIMRRFATGAMSFGSISYEAHSSLAIAMNRIGGKSNSGEGGEDEARFEPKDNGDWERSAIKQVASGRFGVTSYYLSNAMELQIKIAQGAKPGEGGQLPGHKVDEWIGRVRHSTPGVGLISPPPHHDIYSIEDLAQLIFDLKNANPKARVSVKLVSEAGVGTVAAGVAKAYADNILVSGADGGTGASPLSSIRHAGLPWELGLAEAHQTLVQNDLRSRIILQTDGQIRTGRDLAIATLLGAEEWGVATAALVVGGCIMMRKCHLNTCPVGVATQDPELRKLFTGNPDHVVNFFHFLAEDLRGYMAELGFRTVDEMVGKSEFLGIKQNTGHWKYKNLDLSRIINSAKTKENVGVYHQKEQVDVLKDVLDYQLINHSKPALEEKQKVVGEFEIINTDRSVGAMLSNQVSLKYKGEGLPEDTISIKFRGSAGQSFGVFATKGLTFNLEGEANDYFGKGLSGAKLIVYPDRKSTFVEEENIIVGNVALYGATAGEVYINGQAGERFGVRNSGVSAVVEGVGDHGCEYMTGGNVVILGETGYNFAAGMSGGTAYVFDPEKSFPFHCNTESVFLEIPEEEDEFILRKLIENHLTYTESSKAKEIIANWDKYLTHFVKVMPKDYKAVLLKRKVELLKEVV